METTRSTTLDRSVAAPRRAPTVTFFAAQAAELNGLTGMGCMAVRSEGFLRCEGMFHCRLADRAKVIEMMKTGASFRGIVYKGDADIGRRVVKVMVRAFHSQHDGLKLQVQAVGAWWQSLEGPLSGDPL